MSQTHIVSIVRASRNIALINNAESREWRLVPFHSVPFRSTKEKLRAQMKITKIVYGLAESGEEKKIITAFEKKVRVF